MTEVEEVDLGTWMPLAPRVTWRCCECGHSHEREYRVGQDGQIEVRITPEEE